MSCCAGAAKVRTLTESKTKFSTPIYSAHLRTCKVLRILFSTPFYMRTLRVYEFRTTEQQKGIENFVFNALLSAHLTLSTPHPLN
jgi:hypothetical protein